MRASFIELVPDESEESFTDPFHAACMQIDICMHAYELDQARHRKHVSTQSPLNGEYCSCQYVELNPHSL